MSHVPSIDYSCAHCGNSQSYRLVPDAPTPSPSAGAPPAEIPSIDLRCLKVRRQPDLPACPCRCHDQRHSASGDQATEAEPFWPAQLTAAAALALYLTLPHALIMGPKWLVPGVEGVLLLGLVVTTPTRHHMQSSRLRALIVALVGLVSLTTLISLILLARFLLDGSHARGHALLFAGAVLWLTNVLIFGIWYWELDGGGPAHRLAQAKRDETARLPVPADGPAVSSRPAGGPASSTTCTRRTRTRPRSAPRTRCP